MSKEVEVLKDATSLARPLLALLARMSHVYNCSRQVLCPKLWKLEKNMIGTTVWRHRLVPRLPTSQWILRFFKVEQGQAQKGYKAFTAESAESNDEVKGVEEVQNTKTLRHRKSG